VNIPVENTVVTLAPPVVTASPGVEICYSADRVISIEYSCAGKTWNTTVGPMDTKALKYSLNELKFKNQKVIVLAADGTHKQIKNWIYEVKQMHVEKWRPYTTWYGSDGTRHSLNGVAGLLSFLEVIPILGRPAEVMALRESIPSVLAASILDGKA
jgi:hypothetical protein